MPYSQVVFRGLLCTIQCLPLGLGRGVGRLGAAAFWAAAFWALGAVGVRGFEEVEGAAGVVGGDGLGGRLADKCDLRVQCLWVGSGLRLQAGGVVGERVKGWNDSRVCTAAGQHGWHAGRGRGCMMSSLHCCVAGAWLTLEQHPMPAVSVAQLCCAVCSVA